MTLASPALLMTHADAEADWVYAVAEGRIEPTSELQGVHPGKRVLESFNGYPG